MNTPGNKKDDTLRKRTKLKQRGPRPECSSTPCYQHQGSINHGAELSQTAWETKCAEKGCGVFFFPEYQVQIKMLPRRCLSAFFKLSGGVRWRDTWSRRWKHKRGTVSSETSALGLIHLLILADWHLVSSLTVFSLSPTWNPFFCSCQQKGGKTWLSNAVESTRTQVTWRTILVSGWVLKA